MTEPIKFEDIEKHEHGTHCVNIGLVCDKCGNALAIHFDYTKVGQYIPKHIMDIEKKEFQNKIKKTKGGKIKNGKTH